jgi:hypothetical protein
MGCSLPQGLRDLWATHDGMPGDERSAVQVVDLPRLKRGIWLANRMKPCLAGVELRGDEQRSVPSDRPIRILSITDAARNLVAQTGSDRVRQPDGEVLLSMRNHDRAMQAIALKHAPEESIVLPVVLDAEPAVRERGLQQHH